MRIELVSAMRSGGLVHALIVRHHGRLTQTPWLIGAGAGMARKTTDALEERFPGELIEVVGFEREVAR